jgi:hypothetical protein
VQRFIELKKPGCTVYSAIRPGLCALPISFVVSVFLSAAVIADVPVALPVSAAAVVSVIVIAVIPVVCSAVFAAERAVSCVFESSFHFFTLRLS